jgi:hypothetical protein
MSKILPVVYVTKYALTKGIMELHGVEQYDDKMIVATDAYRTCYHKPYWYENRQDAIYHTNELRLKRIRDLKKQITALENLRITETEVLCPD